MKPYIPDKLPLENLDWENFIPMISKANFELARYEGILQGIVNPLILLSPLTTQEAVLSSKIEGTQASLEEVLEYEAVKDKNTEKYEDIQEIINYRRSMFFAIDWMKKKPITLNLLKNIHEILLEGVRGKNKAKGEFRRTQNWIGRPGCTIENASFVPPAPILLKDALSDLEKYIHEDEKDFLVQLAIVHAQFEIIHPFLDGNGRLGRILIPLFLFEKNLLTSPMFYISAYFDTNRDEYYQKLKAITEKHEWNEWIMFFLTAVFEQAKSNSQKAKAVLDLYHAMKTEITSINALDAIFENPIFTGPDFRKRSKMPPTTAKNLLLNLKGKGFLSVVKESKGRQPEVLAFDKLLQIAE
ncbi:Fic family protein [bacterium]|nr:Fic family protein [bacterium]